MHEARSQTRLSADLPVAVSSVLSNTQGVLADISEGGAQVRGDTFPQGTRVWISHKGCDYYGIVAWTEVDRMGIRFNQPEPGLVAAARQSAFTNVAQLRRPVAQTFGRRAAA